MTNEMSILTLTFIIGSLIVNVIVLSKTKDPYQGKFKNPKNQNEGIT